jgi:hypothetical protein
MGRPLKLRTDLRRLLRLALVTAVVLAAGVLTAAPAGAAPTLPKLQIVNGQLDECDPVTQRALSGNPPTGPSAIAGVHYETVSITVGLTGTYTFTMDANDAFAEFLGVYETSFTRDSPVTNVLRTFGASSGENPNFTVDLTAGTTYVVFYASFGSDRFGTYRGVVSGPGTITRSASTITPGCTPPLDVSGRLDGCDPTTRRALTGGNPPTGESATVPTHFETVAFTVSSSGPYDFRLASVDDAFNEFLALYQGSFTPNSPLINVLRTAGSGTGTDPAFTHDLVAGTTYVAVVQAFGSDTDFGPYQATIDGPGTVTQTASSITLGCGSPPTTLNGRLDNCDPESSRVLAGNPPSVGLSPDSPRFETVAFTVSQAGGYTLSMDSGDAFREFLAVYDKSFTPTSPRTNARRAAGDSSGTDPDLTVALVPGTTYVGVFTGFGADDLGDYQVKLSGPGAVQQTASSITLGCPPPPAPPDTPTTPDAPTPPVSVEPPSTPDVPAPPALPRDTGAPVIASLTSDRSRFRVGAGATALSAARRPVQVGTTFRYTLSEAAKVTVVVSRSGAGRLAGGRCVKPTPKVSRKPKCDLPAGTLIRRGTVGKNQIPFTGRLGRRALTPGTYRATFTATDLAGNRSRAKSLTFTIIR